jgi:FixJ family two-component response regulator
VLGARRNVATCILLIQSLVLIQFARVRLSKQIAHDIGIAEATVKMHRSKAMQKMKAGSLPEFRRIADKLKLVPDTPRRS